MSDQSTAPASVQPRTAPPAPRPDGGGDGPRNPWAFLQLAPPAPAPGVEVPAPAPRAEVPAPPSEDGRDWADDERLDELFSAWAEAALSAEVISERGFMDEHPGSATGPGEPMVAEVEVGGPDAWPVAPVPPPSQLDAPASPEVAPPVGPEAAARAPEPLTPWSRSDDDVIPRTRHGRRWRR